MRAEFQSEFWSQLVTYWFGSLDAKVNLVSFHQMYNCKKIVTVCRSGLKSTTSYTVIDWFIYIGGLEGNVLSYGTSILHNLSPIWFSSHGLIIDWPLQWSIKTKDHNKIYSKNGDDEKAEGIRRFQEFHSEKQMALAIKVHIFWEDHKILRNHPLTFDCMYCSQKLGENFANFLWSSQNIWTL